MIDVGKGFGHLPASLNILRPFAVTAEFGADFPGAVWSQGNENPTNLNWGFTVQYSLPYFNSNVAEIDNGFLKHLIPLTEVAFSAPVANVPREPTRSPERSSRAPSIWPTNGNSPSKRFSQSTAPAATVSA